MNKTQCLQYDSSTLLFPGQLKEEINHTLITPLNHKYIYDYLKVENALSEFNTLELKANARKNLGIDDNSYKWSVLEESYFVKDTTLFIDAVVVDDKILISGKVKQGLLIL